MTNGVESGLSLSSAIPLSRPPYFASHPWWDNAPARFFSRSRVPRTVSWSFVTQTVARSFYRNSRSRMVNYGTCRALIGIGAVTAHGIVSGQSERRNGRLPNVAYCLSTVTVPVKSKTWRSRPMRKITRECCVATRFWLRALPRVWKRSEFRWHSDTTIPLLGVQKLPKATGNPGGRTRNHASIVRKPAWRLRSSPSYAIATRV